MKTNNKNKINNKIKIRPNCPFHVLALHALKLGIPLLMHLYKNLKKSDSKFTKIHSFELFWIVVS